jgi:hypothetical protein
LLGSLRLPGGAYQGELRFVRESMIGHVRFWLPAQPVDATQALTPAIGDLAPLRRCRCPAVVVR